jgi:HEAT repeat protein
VKQVAPASIAIALIAVVLLMAGRRSTVPDVLFDGRPVSAWALDLNSPSALVRDQAQDASRRFDSNALPALVQLLRTPDPVLARPAKAMARWLPRKMQAFVFRVVNPFEAPARRAAGAQALRWMGSRAAAALPDLRNSLRDDQTAAWYAALALAQMGEPGTTTLAAALAEVPPAQEAFVCYALSTQGVAASNAIPALAALLEKGEPQTSGKAASTLVSLGALAVPSFMHALAQGDAQVRILAIDALGKIGPVARDALPKLIQMTHNDTPGVREAAVDAIARVRPSAPEVVAALSTALRDSNRQVRVKALEALGRTPERAGPAMDGLLELLKDESPEARGQAAALLGEMGHPTAPVLAALQSRLTDRNDFVQNQARQALTKLQRP